MSLLLFQKQKADHAQLREQFEGEFEELFESVAQNCQQIGVLDEHRETLKKLVDKAILIDMRAKTFSDAIDSGKSQYNDYLMRKQEAAAGRASESINENDDGAGSSSGASSRKRSAPSPSPDSSAGGEPVAPCLSKVVEQYMAENAAEELSEEDAKSHRFSASCGSKLGANEELGDDEELRIEEETISLRCPITRQKMVEPMKSKVCGHVYSKIGIFSLLKGKRNVKCPIAGCNKQISKGSLVLDKEREKFIIRESNKRARHASQASSSQY
jgi:hypothetical protein